MATVEIEFAAPFKGGPPNEPRDNKTVWEASRRAVITTNTDESFAAGLERAIAALDLRPEDGTWWTPFDSSYPVHVPIQFFEGAGTKLEEGGGQLVLLDRTGLAYWSTPDLRYVSVGDLLRASEAGVLRGDPRRVYVVQSSGGAGGPDGNWYAVLQVLETAWQVLESLGIAYAGVEALRWLKEGVGRGADTLRRNIAQWMGRGGTPKRLGSLVGGHAWEAESLAKTLGCTESDAAVLLELLGAADPPTQEGRVLRAFMYGALTAYPEGEPDKGALREALAASFRGFADSGTVPSFSEEVWQETFERSITSDGLQDESPGGSFSSLIDTEDGSAYELEESEAEIDFYWKLSWVAPLLTLSLVCGLVAAQYNRLLLFPIAFLLFTTVIGVKFLFTSRRREQR